MSDAESDFYEHLRLSIENQNRIKESLHDMFLADQNDESVTRAYIERIVSLEGIVRRNTERLAEIESFQLAMRLEERRGKSKLIILVVTSVIGWMGVVLSHYLIN